MSEGNTVRSVGFVNAERADRGAQAIAVYAHQTGLKVDPDRPDNYDGMETAAIDVLSDIRHYFDQNGLDFDRALECSEQHFTAEKAEDQ